MSRGRNDATLGGAMTTLAALTQVPKACVLSFDAHGTLRAWSASAQALLGYTHDDAEGKALIDLLPFLADDEAEGWCARADGSKFRALVANVSTPEMHDGANALRSLVVTDVTARFAREEAARRVRQRIHQIATSVAHLVFFSIDFLHNDVEVWGGLAEVIGWTRGSPPRELSELLRLVHPEDLAMLQAALNDTIAAQSQFDVEFRVRADLDERWLHVAGCYVDDNPPRIVGTGVNVTQRREVDSALRTSEAKLHAVLDATIDGIMTIDARGLVASFNRTAVTMFRGMAQQIDGTHWSTLLNLEQSVLPRSGTLLEAVGHCFDGSTFTMECGFTEIDVGPERLVVVVMRDVTQRRLIEQQVLDVSEQLQRQIGQDLHDGLGQLLTGTAFLAKGLQRGVDAEYQPQALRVVDLINQAVARVRSLARGLSPIHVDTQSLDAVLRHVVSESSELLGIDCELDLQQPVDTARPATVAQLCLIAREAITNAVRHGQARRVVVRLGREGERCLLAVDDDGIGIGEIDKPLEGLGLRSMRYRARMIGGSLDVARTSTGTSVRCSWSD